MAVTARSTSTGKSVRDRKRKRPESLTDKAYRTLEEMIVTLQLEPGEVLSEAALSDELAIGRTPIREALHRLAREGLVVILPRKGILVSDINPQSQLQLLEVRRELDRLAARSAALRRTDEERAQFAAIAEGMDEASDDCDDLAFIRLDGQLNTLMSAAARNPYVSRASGLIAGLSRRFWYMHHKKAADLPRMARLHARLARQIARGDADAAGKASDKLIDYVESFTRTSVAI